MNIYFFLFNNNKKNNYNNNYNNDVIKVTRLQTKKSRERSDRTKI